MCWRQSSKKREGEDRKRKGNNYLQKKDCHNGHMLSKTRREKDVISQLQMRYHFHNILVNKIVHKLHIYFFFQPACVRPRGVLLV